MYGAEALYLRHRKKIEHALAAFWDGQYPTIGQSWRRHSPHLITLFDLYDRISGPDADYP